MVCQGCYCQIDRPAGILRMVRRWRAAHPAKSMPHYFAIIPAAGHSTRMGQAKLLLPVAGEPLIVLTIGAWRRSRIDHVLAVVRNDDAPLASVVRSAQAT